MNAPNDGDAPSVSDSVAGTAPPTGRSACVEAASASAPASSSARIPPTTGSESFEVFVSSVIRVPVVPLRCSAL